ncbi:MAG: hypothetical protein ABIO84_04475 [Lysobacter sp.]
MAKRPSTSDPARSRSDGGERRKHPRSASQIDAHADVRNRIAREAARLIGVGEAADYPHARNKAAQRLGVNDATLLPANRDIEVALREYQRLFRPDTSDRTQRYREAALEAMAFLASFQPMLAGPVLHGTADAHAVVTVHLHADDSDAVIHLLEAHGIDADSGVVRLRLDPHRDGEFPVWRFFAGDVPFELVGLPAALARQPPLAPGDDRAMPRASAGQLRRLMEAERLTAESGSNRNP